MADNKKHITLTAAAATILVAIAGWAAGMSTRVSTLEANEAAHEQRITKAEQDAAKYRDDVADIRDRLARLEGYLKQLAR
jgi:ubiquinone biosynthesis protein UbiJ